MPAITGKALPGAWGFVCVSYQACGKNTEPLAAPAAARGLKKQEEVCPPSCGRQTLKPQLRFPNLRCEISSPWVRALLDPFQRGMASLSHASRNSNWIAGSQREERSGMKGGQRWLAAVVRIRNATEADINAISFGCMPPQRSQRDRSPHRTCQTGFIQFYYLAEGVRVRLKVASSGE